MLDKTYCMSKSVLMHSSAAEMKSTGTACTVFLYSNASVSTSQILVLCITNTTKIYSNISNMYK